MSLEEGPAFKFHDSVLLVESRGTSGVPGVEIANSKHPLDGGGGRADASDSDASGPGNMSDPPVPSGRPPGLNRRRSQSQSVPRRPPVRQSLQPPSQHIYPISHPQDNIHGSAGPAVNSHGSLPQYQSSSPPYDSWGNFVGQYTTPPHLSMAHTPPPFSYSHMYHHPPVSVSPDSNLVPQNMHQGFHSMMQPHAPVYPYQRQSPESISAHADFSGSGPSSHYPFHENSSPPPHTTHSSQPSTGQFPSFFSSMSSPQYPSPSQSFPTPPPLYPAQYPASTYPQHPQHFAPSPKQEGQGIWWYVPHNSALTPTHYDSARHPYHGPYPVTYSHSGQPDTEASYGQSASGLSSTSLFSHQTDRFPRDSPSPTTLTTGSLTISTQAEQVLSTENKSPVERPIIRRDYHPNPPAHRSEWVMWVGNVPSDSTHDELWRFFNQSQSVSQAESPSSLDAVGDASGGGVVSIFLISRSSCAFINFISESHLETAIARFHGQPLRPNDSRCPRLVCRVRRKDDDLTAGVGGQRGMGLHMRWIKEQKGRLHEPSQASRSAAPGERSATPSSSPDQSRRSSTSSNEEDGSSQMDNPRVTTKGSSSGSFASTGSYASTNSSVLSRHFPKRYFILKSLTQFDLDLSVEKGVWATQRHNESVLDQAYRTAKDVFLIFGVNKSGEFYGYARMAGPVLQGEHKVSWASRTDSPSSRSSMSPAAGRGGLQSEIIPEEPGSPSPLSARRMDRSFFPAGEERFVESSPLPVASPDSRKKHKTKETFWEVASTNNVQTPGPIGRVLQSAPAEVGPTRAKMSMHSPAVKHNTYRDNVQIATPSLIAAKMQSAAFELDAEAPMRAIRTGKGRYDDSLQAVEAEEDEIADGARREKEGRDGDVKEDTWGEPFKIEWICTDRLQFYRTRHLRNPWNHDREVKVSRDGTELEPTIGQKLLEEWERLSEQPQQPTQGSSKASASATRTTGTAKPATGSPMPYSEGRRGTSRS